MAIIVDIDDTLLRYGDQPINRTIEYIRTLEGPVFLITGRSPRQRRETVRALRAAGVRYSRLFMAPDSIDDEQYKYETAMRLKRRYNITVAIDNNPRARAMYNKAGLATKDPAKLPDIGKFWTIF